MEQVNLQNIPQIPIGEIAALPINELVALQAEADETLADAKKLKQWIDGAIRIKYEDAVAVARRDAGKESGTVHVMDEGYKISSTVSKRIEWNQKKLAEITQDIASNGDEVSEYVDVAYKIAERKYSAWPEHIRKIFEPARTFKTSLPTIKITIGDGGVA